MNTNLQTVLFGHCPCCGKGRLFNGYLTVAPHCEVCDLDYSMFDPGDGPAVFVVLIVGAVVCGAALLVEFTFQPPYWLHAVLWIPTITVLTFGLLRVMKSLLLVLQYRHKAGEGRVQ